MLLQQRLSSLSPHSNCSLPMKTVSEPSVLVVPRQPDGQPSFSAAQTVTLAQQQLESWLPRRICLNSRFNFGCGSFCLSGEERLLLVTRTYPNLNSKSEFVVVRLARWSFSLNKTNCGTSVVRHLSLRPLEKPLGEKTATTDLSGIGIRSPKSFP